MKKLLPFLFLVSAPAYADMNHSISSSVKFESLSAASTADKIGSSYSISGNNVTTVDSNSASTIGGFGSATNGVPAVTFPASLLATALSSFGLEQAKKGNKKDDKVASENGMVQTIRVITPIKIEGAEVIDPKPKK